MAESGGGGIPFFSTHPTTEDRIANVRALARGLDGRSDDGQFASVRSRAARY
jgi:predicted Zn-dependent protease